MRATCNKKEDNFITYHSTREKIINDVRDWEKLNPEKRKEYTIKYYKTEKGHRKRLAQQKRYREKRKLIKENEKLKNDKMELLKKVDMFQKKKQKLEKKLNKAIELLIEYNLPCDIENFNIRNADYCSSNCSVDEEVFKKCWLKYIEQELENE